MCTPVDNDASVSVIAHDLVVKMKPIPDVRKSSKTTLVVFEMVTLEVMGEVFMNIEIEELQACNFSLLVAPSNVTSNLLVLRLDFLERYYMIVDTVQCELCYLLPNEPSISVALTMKPSLEVQCLVRNRNEVRICSISVCWYMPECATVALLTIYLDILKL
jgi:hypothetical protein